MTKSHYEKTFCLFVFVACAALNVWFSSVGWRNNLLEGHEFRQTQTALTSYYFQKDGWALAYPLPLFGPPWSAPLEFPLFQYGAAVFSTATGLPLEPAGRLVSLGFFYLSLPALFLLLRHLSLPLHRRWLFLGLVLVSPAYLYYSRSFMIESTALCAAAWFLHAYCRAVETRRSRWVAWAALLGAVAAVVKITTFAIFLVPAAWFTGFHLWREYRQRAGGYARISAIISSALGATVPGVLLGFAWLRYGDSVKADSPLAHFLLSSELSLWTYGSLSQRLSLSFWETLLKTTGSSTLMPANLLLFAVFGLFIGRIHRRASWVLMSCFLAGPLVLANLYFVHDYYYYSTGVFLLAGLVLAWNELLDLPSVPAPGKWLAIVLCLAIQVYGFTHSYYGLQADPRPEIPELARVLSTITEPDDVILIYGLEWNPVVPYYSGRRVIMVTRQYLEDHASRNVAIGRLPPGRIGALVAVGDTANLSDYMRMLAHSLDLRDRPMFTSADAHIYIADRLATRAIAAIAKVPLHNFSLNSTVDSSMAGVKQQRYHVATLSDQSAFDMMSPHPVEVLVPFGIAASLVDGKRVFNAHSPTEIIFEVPPGAHSIHAAFGVLSDAYEKGHVLNGMQFLVEWVKPSGDRVVIFDRFLDPNLQPMDRGTKQLDVTLPAGAQGRVVFSTLPGPSHSISFTWGYWTDLILR